MPNLQNHVPVQFEPWPIQFDVVMIVVQVGTGSRYRAFFLKIAQKPGWTWCSWGYMFCSQKGLKSIVNVSITMPHIQNHVPVHFDSTPIQFDVVMIMVQARTGSGYRAFFLKIALKPGRTWCSWGYLFCSQQGLMDSKCVYYHAPYTESCPSAVWNHSNSIWCGHDYGASRNRQRISHVFPQNNRKPRQDVVFLTVSVLFARRLTW